VDLLGSRTSVGIQVILSVLNHDRSTQTVVRISRIPAIDDARASLVARGSVRLRCCVFLGRTQQALERRRLLKYGTPCASSK
jgi:hypothetical protein